MKNNIEKFKENFSFFAIFFLVFLSILCFLYFFSHGLTVVFGDSKGHMNISRRVIDSPTPGLAQLGAYWLPLAHLLTLSLVWQKYLWISGIAGTWFNLIGYIFTTIYLYLLTKRITDSKICGIACSLVFALNPNILFLQSTPMTEMLFIATTVIGSYYFFEWSLSKKITKLIKAAFFIMLASLTRYEGWALAVFTTGYIFLELIFAKGREKTKREADLITFSAVAWFGIILWILWGWLLVGDPLDFMRNDLSAKSQTHLYYEDIKATGDGNMWLALTTNILAVYHTAGPVVAIFLIAGVLLHLLKEYKHLLEPSTYIWFLLMMPFVFDILTVFSGNVPVEVPELSRQPPPGSMFNVRYSLFVLPFVVVLLAINFRNKFLTLIVGAIIIVSYFFMIFPNPQNIAVLNEAGASGTPVGVKNTINWFVNSYDDGYVLASTGAMDGLMFDAKMPLKNYITEGAYKLWPPALKDPKKVVKWILLDEGNKRDAVNKHIDKRKLHHDFYVVYKSGTFTIWKIKAQ